MRKTPESKVKKVLQLAKDGKLTYYDIKDRVGVSIGTISRIVSEAKAKNPRQVRRDKAHKAVHKLIETEGGSFHKISKRLGVSSRTVNDLAGEPLGKDVDLSAIQLPEPITMEFMPYTITKAGHWLILGDVHIPCHDLSTVQLAVEHAKRDGAVGVLLNGDILDCHEVSSHNKDPRMPRYKEELQLGRQFIAWLRQELPKAEIVYKIGNHEERLDRYINTRAPALEELEGFNTFTLLNFQKHGIIEVRDKRVIQLGGLHVVHGHEYSGGGGVNPARWLYLRARDKAICNHFHRTSEHHTRNISQKFAAAWSVGCACNLHPAYAPLNEWNNGYAIIDVQSDGTFGVRNNRVIEGKVY